MKRCLLAAFWMLVLLIPNASASAQDEIDINITTDGRAEDGSEFNIGDRIILALEIHHPQGSRTIIPALPANWGTFEIVSQPPAETEIKTDGDLITRQSITITTFTPGEHTTPPFTITFQDADGSITEKDAPIVTLTVYSVLQEGDTELRDIKPQAKMSVPFPWAWLLAGMLLAGAAAGIVWWLRRRRAEPEGTPENVSDPRPPHLVALEELERIEALRLPEQERFKEHYTLVSDCLRHYLEGQFNLRVLDRTTRELRRELLDSPLTTEASRALLELFTESDLVKFARFKPTRDDAESHLRTAVTLVEQTRPEPPPIPEEGT